MRSFGSRDQLNHFLRAAKPVRNQARITAQSFHGELSRHAPFRIRGVFRHESNFIEANSRTPAKICFQAFGKTGRLDRRLHKRANEGKKIFARHLGTERNARHVCVREQVGDEKVVLGLSGGVDSSVTAALLHKAIGDQLTCIFVNNGLLRAREEEIVQRVFGENFHIKLKYVDASERFLSNLRGVTDPEQKRKIIGNEFIRVFEDAIVDLAKTHDGSAASNHKFRFLAQGTLYPDVIESVSIEGNPAQVIKTHHNVGGLPEKMHFELVEPVRQLFKDEVRQAGLQLGLPKEIVYRQPFPGPGLAVRILGEVTPERLAILREADTIVQSEMEAADWYYKVWQSFAVLLPVQSVGVMGDQRTYENTIALRIVESQDGMTADWVRIPYELLERISNRICNEVKGVNRVVFDISSKPPSTIEWE